MEHLKTLPAGDQKAYLHKKVLVGILLQKMKTENIPSNQQNPIITKLNPGI